MLFRSRKISTFGYAEFTNECNYENDLVNLQYTLFITRTYFKENKILQAINENCGKDEGDLNSKCAWHFSSSHKIQSHMETPSRRVEMPGVNSCVSDCALAIKSHKTGMNRARLFRCSNLVWIRRVLICAFKNNLEEDTLMNASVAKYT